MEEAPSKSKNNLPWALLWLLSLALAAALFYSISDVRHNLPRQITPRLLNQKLFLSKAASISPQGRQSAMIYASLVDELAARPRSPRQRAQAASDFNQSRIAFASDMEVWGVTDYWSSPLETFDKGRGDCEDFAISAYELLRNSGTPDGMLRMGYARILLGGRLEPHMVALLADGDDFWVIDNTRAEVIRLSERSEDLEIVFSFDHQSIYERAGKNFKGHAQDRIGKWRDLLAKAKSEGFH